MSKKEFTNYCTKKLLAALLCAAVVLCAMPIPAMAANKNVAGKMLRSASSDFVIENGVLVEYQGPGGDVVVPDGVTEIGEAAFFDWEGSNVTSVTLPIGVTKIDEHAFYECTGLTSITLPVGLKEIEGYAFENCESLISVALPEGLKKIGYYCFKGCKKLTYIAVPGTVQDTCESAFEDTKWLTNKRDQNSYVIAGSVLINGASVRGTAKIPDGISRIGEMAFYGNTNITSVSIPDSCTNVDRAAFEGCVNIRGITLPDKMDSIGQEAFRGCSSLNAITIPQNITAIDVGTFEECSSLTAIKIPTSVKYYGASAFQGCESLVSITIPDGMTMIEDQTFCYCTSLTNIKLPKSVVTIDDGAFFNCSRLTSVVISEGVKQINWRAFANCSRLTSLTIPKSVTEIQEGAFEGCSNLTSVTLLNGMTEIDNGSFYGCKKLIMYSLENSKAQAYAKKNNIPFVAIDSKERRYISGASVTIKPFTCTGKAIKPTTQIVVKLGGKTLVYGRDYKITKYANNTNPGTANVTITGIGSYTGTKTATFKITLATPSSVKQSARTTSSIKLSWKKVPGATSYVVERAPYGSKKFKKVVTVKTTSYINKKLTAGQFYQYRVRAYCGKLVSAYSKTVAVNTALSTPFLSKVTSPKKKQAAVTWKKTRGATGYQVYRATSKRGKYKKVATVKFAKYTDKKVSRKKIYYYKVRAYRKVKGKVVYSGYSKVKSTRVK